LENSDKNIEKKGLDEKGYGKVMNLFLVREGFKMEGIMGRSRKGVPKTPSKAE